jgi:hypothetical protein
MGVLLISKMGVLSTPKSPPQIAPMAVEFTIVVYSWNTVFTQQYAYHVCRLITM